MEARNNHYRQVTLPIRGEQSALPSTDSFQLVMTTPEFFVANLLLLIERSIYNMRNTAACAQFTCKHKV